MLGDNCANVGMVGWGGVCVGGGGGGGGGRGCGVETNDGDLVR